ncbi:hypothetical protein TraAM80_01547 [Trypanosoma rangeli]|uniref:Uncharacterized protein n=1 Tax=Trypanosoma rangeli TaxID=5698 RepID=A0A3R7KVD9_TRYRA|nr:uncharacterized protein TraAM80_01547 [Trypanosoma rangeli]RNF10500.1 hypothetical protein TraAM80_01547 [Trypanosoma rangeli]|eukprot:RNF10500.1 hypothetical protein TraAM80_01547 [Trypanosoma rangeli]
MDAQSSECSFVDHGQEVELGVGARPEWSVDKPGGAMCDDDDDDDDDDSDIAVGGEVLRSVENVSNAASISGEASGLSAAMRKAALHAERLLRANQQLVGENEALTKANSALAALNQSLTRHNDAFAEALASLSRKQEFSQHALVELSREVREIKAAVKFLVEVAAKGGQAVGPRE